MNIAVIKIGECVDNVAFETIETAQEFLAAGVWPGADAVTPLPEGYGIGDFYDGSTWTKQERPEPEPVPEIPDYMAFVAGLMEGYADGQ